MGDRAGRMKLLTLAFLASAAVVLAIPYCPFCRPLAAPHQTTGDPIR
jgi:hypothetical protein